PPILLIGNEDVDEKCSEPIIPFASQKYNSNSVHPLMVENAVRTKTSMNLNHINDCKRYGSDKITTVQKQNVADLFGTHCKSLFITIPNYDGTLKFMEEMIRAIRLQREQQQKSLLQWFTKINNEKSTGKMKTKINSKMCSIS
ncbi:hypothetical protein WUBG_06283, partial [Wuchereria bancrofti]